MISANSIEGVLRDTTYKTLEKEALSFNFEWLKGKFSSQKILGPLMRADFAIVTIVSKNAW